VKLLITGSAGFIGSYAVKAAIARGWEVDSLDVRSQTHARRADVRLLSRVEADVVLHLAAYSSNAGFAEDLSENYANNVFGLWNVLRLARGARVVYASSSAVYGNSLPSVDACDAVRARLNNIEWPTRNREDQVLNHLTASHYAKSKLMNEMMAADFPNTLGLRIFNAYGAGDELKPPGKQAPPTWMRAAKERGEPMVIYGDGTQAKDFIHVSDVVEIIMRLIESDETGIVNVGTGVATSFCDMARLISDPHQAVIFRCPIPDPASYQFFTRADTFRLLSIIGPYKFKSIEEGLGL
jgi:nucleoside-diphosphate-sugar epimerase